MIRITLLAIMSSLCATSFAATTAPSSAWQPREFPISFWCAPPPQDTSVERYQQIKDAGFTFVMPPCSKITPADNRKILDVCQQVGLEAFILDTRVYKSVKDKDVRQNLDGAIADYSKHPALAGYMLVDEPLADAYPGIAAVIAYLKDHDPQHVGFVNLFPNVVAPNLLKARSYEDYVRRFAIETKPFVISYDHYPLQTKGDDGLFIANLAVVRKVALETNLPFWNIVQVTQWGGMRNLTLGELQYQAMQSLAMGAKGLLWFTYCTPVGDKTQNWQHAMIDRDGKATEHDAMVRQVNARLLAFGNELLGATSSGYFQTGKTPAGGKAQPKDSPVTFAENPPPMTVGLFEANGKRLIMIASSDYRKDIEVATTFASPVEQFDTAKKSWSSVDSSVQLKLAPGAGALFRSTR